jgi:hypothetical protein
MGQYEQATVAHSDAHMTDVQKVTFLHLCNTYNERKSAA